MLQEVANGVTTVYQYDPNGNTISKTTGTSQVRYYWDDEDKMVRLEDSVVMNFKTDGLGFRRMKEVVGQGQTWFVYDLGESETPGLAPLVAEYDQNGNLVAKYHHGEGLMAMTRNNASYWYGFEAIGTARQLMDGQGQVSDAYAFDAWGNELTSPQSQVLNPFKYVGKHGYYMDLNNLLILLGIRYYDAKIARFWTLDPLRRDGWNWYLYVKDNSVNLVDPSGLFKLIGCNPKDHPLTFKALKMACEAGEKCKDLDDSQRNCVKRFCDDNTTPFRCGSPYCAARENICGYTCPLGSRYEGIVICTSVVATEKCKPQGCNLSKEEQIAKTILHEILHLCGIHDYPDHSRERRQCSIVNGQEICVPDRGKPGKAEDLNPADRLAIKCLGLEEKGCQPLPAYKYSDPSGWNPCQDWRRPQPCQFLYLIGLPPWVLPWLP